MAGTAGCHADGHGSVSWDGWYCWLSCSWSWFCELGWLVLLVVMLRVVTSELGWLVLLVVMLMVVICKS